MSWVTIVSKSGGIGTRAIAVDALMRRFAESASLDAIYRSLPLRKLSIQDRKLVHELVDGVLRNRGKIDFQISNLSDRPIDRIDEVILWILRVSLYEMESLRIPNYASVNTAVSLCSSVGRTSAKGFVNAVLREFQRHPPKLPEGNSVEDLAIRFSHPGWLVRRCLKRWGLTRTVEWLDCNNRLPEPTLWVNPERIEIEQFKSRLATDGFRVELVEGVPNCVRVYGRSLTEHELYRKGYCFFMDLSSQRIANLVDLSGKQLVGDFCAAPGGKGFLMASRLDEGALIVSVDLNRSRLELMERRADLYGLNHVNLVEADLQNTAPFGRCFDSILLDVPCSGLGTIRSNPDIRWAVQEPDLMRFRERQLEILQSAFSVLKDGRELVYSTCSTEPEENEEVVEEFLARQGQAELGQEFLRTFPENAGGDGFFAAKVRRV